VSPEPRNASDIRLGLEAKRKTSTRDEYFAFCEGFRMTAHRDDSACRGAVVRKPPVKERAGDGVPTVTRALWRFDRGGDGGRKTRERGREKMRCAGGSRARLSRDEDGFRGRLPC
jgi:hypothetical protein